MDIDYELITLNRETISQLEDSLNSRIELVGMVKEALALARHW